MSYLGKTQLKSSDVQRFDVTGSTSATHVLGWKAPNEQSLIITINGVKQQDDAYSIAGSPTTVTLTDALIVTDKLEIVGIVDVGTMNVPGVGSVQTDQLADDAVTADKLANSINTDIAANTAKVTNATHTGDVTGATALTIAADAVDIAMLSATGTADATTFLRGDNAWAAAGGGKVLQAVMGTSNTTVDQTAVAYIDTGLTIDITPSATSSKILILANHGTIATTGSTSFHLKLLRDAVDINAWGTGWLAYSSGTYIGVGGTFTYMDSPSSTSAITYKTQLKCESAAGGKVAKVMAGPTDGSIIALEIGA